MYCWPKGDDRYCQQSAKGRQAMQKLAYPYGGTPDAVPVLRAFLRKHGGSEHARDHFFLLIGRSTPWVYII